MPTANFRDFFICEFRTVMNLSTWQKIATPHSNFNAPSFAKGIEHVFRLRSCEQMLRIDASRIIAAMTHDHARWNRTIENGMAHSMGVIRSTFAIINDVESAVTSIGYA